MPTNPAAFSAIVKFGRSGRMQRGKGNKTDVNSQEALVAASSTHLFSYEQFGRLEILEGGLSGSPFVDVSALANLAQHQLDSGYGENAAGLLRAAEHISFAALAPTNSPDLSSRIPVELKNAAAGELDRLIRNAEERWSSNASNRKVIENIYASALDQARTSFARGAYRPALQLARAGEVLADLGAGLPATMPGDRELTRRLAS